MTNDDLARYVDTSDEWIRERTGIRERRIATQDEALSDIALPAVAGGPRGGRAPTPSEIDLVICATVTPDMLFPTTSALMADALGMRNAAAYDLLAGCTGFMYAIAQAYGMLASGLSKKALVVGGDLLSKILDWDDRSTLVLFGDGAGAVVMEPVASGGFLGFELGADGGGGIHLCFPAAARGTSTIRSRSLKMNGREVFKFATRVMVSSAEAVLEQCGRTIDDVDVYVPHQANKRIIDYAVGKLGIAPEKTVVNVDRFGNTSSGSIPLALADARAEGRLDRRRARVDDGDGRRPHVGLGADGMERHSPANSGRGGLLPHVASRERRGGSRWARSRSASRARERSRPAWAASSPRPFPPRWRSIARQRGVRPRSPEALLRHAARGARRDRGAAAGARRDVPRHPRRGPRRGASSRTSSSATRSASSRRSRRSRRMGTGEAIGLVRERGLAMAEAARLHPGSMAAILGLEDEAVEELCRRIVGVWPANYNCPGPDRGLRRERRGRRVLRRGRERSARAERSS